jgi:hypothetical protein
LSPGNDADGDAVTAKNPARLSLVYRPIKPEPFVMVTTACGGRAKIMV